MKTRSIWTLALVTVFFGSLQACETKPKTVKTEESALTKNAPSEKLAAIQTYTPAILKAARESGQLIVLHFNAPWCTYCRKQKSAWDNIVIDKKFSDVNFIQADHDTNKALEEEYGVTTQSTFVVFRGKDDPSKYRKASFITDEKEIRGIIELAIERK